METNSNSMKAHFNDLERQVKPQLKEYRPSKENDFPIVRLVSIVGVFSNTICQPYAHQNEYNGDNDSRKQHFLRSSI